MKKEQAEGYKVETVNQVTIDEWKKKYGRVFRVDVAGRSAYLKKPDRRVLALASVEGGKDPFKYNEVLLRNCWLAGDETIQEDDELFLGVSAKLQELIKIEEADLVEL